MSFGWKKMQILPEVVYYVGEDRSDQEVEVMLGGDWASLLMGQ